MDDITSEGPRPSLLSRALSSFRSTPSNPERSSRPSSYAVSSTGTSSPIGDFKPLDVDVPNPALLCSSLNPTVTDPPENPHEDDRCPDAVANGVFPRGIVSVSKNNQVIRPRPMLLTPKTSIPDMTLRDLLPIDKILTGMDASERNTTMGPADSAMPYNASSDEDDRRSRPMQHSAGQMTYFLISPAKPTPSTASDNTENAPSTTASQRSNVFRSVLGDVDDIVRAPGSPYSNYIPRYTEVSTLTPQLKTEFATYFGLLHNPIYGSIVNLLPSEGYIVNFQALPSAGGALGRLPYAEGAEDMTKSLRERGWSVRERTTTSAQRERMGREAGAHWRDSEVSERVKEVSAGKHGKARSGDEDAQDRKLYSSNTAELRSMFY